MLDSFIPNQRRQPPSPLVFTPETIFSSPPAASQSNANGPSAASASGSGANTVSMPFVRRHVTRRLKAAKSECDKELQRITNNITTFFEERLRESAEQEAEREIFEQERDRARDSPAHWQDIERESVAHAAWFADQSALQTDDSSDGGYEGEGDFQRHGRQRTLPEAQNVPSLTHKGSSSGLAAASSSSSLSPASLRRTHPVPWDSKPMASSSSPSSAGSSMILPEAPISRIRSDPPPPPISSSRTPQSGIPSRRLSRSIHIPARATRSGQSSRSTSRSRSPLPPQTTHASFSDTFQQPTPPPTSSSNRRSSRILLDDPIDPIMTALYDLIAVATDIMEMTLNQLTAQPKVCETFVQRIQNIGKAWEQHPNWHGRNWYVQVLLAVASLSRVVEWWEAEKLFWNFDDNEEEQDEPLAFVTKQTEEFSVLDDMDRLTPEDDSKYKVGRTVSQNRKSRDEQPKAVGSSTSPKESSTEAASRGSSSKFLPNTESARVLATERLRLQAETAQNQNIVVELSLDGDHVIWVNYAWSVVVGSDADEIPGTRISYCLHPSDLDVFRNASDQLQEDQQSKTMQVRFKLQIVPDDDRELPTGGALYQKMEGNGMLMIDRDDGMPSHTMWVVRPLAPPRFERYPNPTIGPPDITGMGASTSDLTQPENNLPFPQPISVEPILCRICECQIPQWYFEKHSETCVELHRMEAEIAECNESISELRNTVRSLALRMDQPSPGTIPEYRGMPIFAPSSSPISSSPLHIFKFGKMQKFGVKKMQRRLLDQLDDILQVALEVSVPSLKEEESKEPIERQRLLSPGSERKMTQIRNWSKPVLEDSALSQLVEDTERIMRQKIDSVIRMQNTMRYSEKVWCEWREKVEEVLDLDCDSCSSGGSEDEQGIPEEPSLLSLPPPTHHREDDQSSTVSEYAFTGEVGSSSDPTPLAPSPVQPHSTDSRSPSSMAVENRTGSSSGIGARGMHYTRSSTPSSISSPLAYAAPIVASSSPEDMPPPMSLDDDSANKSQSMQEPKLFITPPISPMLSAKDVPTVTRESSLGRRHSRRHSVNPLAISGSPSSGNPLSPRQSAVPLSRSTPTSIKDFDVIKPISKGAFGSVFLAKKKATGDYYAIKVLKKADMISKNQVTNVKAERMILMKQAESPFVAKLYFTFQSKDNLYLVMEYLNGGDCAALIKSLGSLPEEWTRQYIAEVTLGLEYLHDRGIVHRDLKPDNLLIDSHGHLKLTDFGLSRIGLLGRQSREVASRRQQFRSRPPSLDSAYMSSPFLHGEGGSYFSQRTHTAPRVANNPYTLPTDDVESNGSDSVHGWQALRGVKPTDSPLQSFASELTNDLRSHNDMRANQDGNTPPGEQKFVGTPDYLAPETILGLRGDDASVDWWALGVITYEFLYGIPPFHAESPEKLFENILSGRIDWHEDWVDFSYAARDFMERLMTISVPRRLGANGAHEVKTHAFFEGIEWDQVTTTEAAFIPQVTDPESTDYFDPRGAIPQLFHDDDDHVAITNRASDSPKIDTGATLPVTAPVAITGGREHSSSTASSDDFGSFSFKNIPVLKQANDDVIRKLKTDQMVPLSQTLSEPMSLHQRKRSMSTRIKKPPSVITSGDPNKPLIAGPPSPATSTSSVASSPSRGSMPPSTPGSAPSHSRKPSEFGAVERFKNNNHLDSDRRNSMPSRLRTASVSSTGDGSGSEAWGSSAGQGSNCHETPPSSVHSIDLRKGPDLNDRVVTCLLAEDNPITAKIIETLLIRLGCRCVVVADGSEAISVAMGDIKFDCILMDLQMPVLDGESAAKYIRTTNGKNSNTPIISVSAYSAEGFEANSTFAASLSKPLQKADLLAAMQKLGFKTSTLQGPRSSRITATRPA